MLCPLCKVEMAIKDRKNVLKTEDSTPKLYLVLGLSCRNKKCTNYDKIVEESETEQPLSIG